MKELDRRIKAHQATIQREKAEIKKLTKELRNLQRHQLRTFAAEQDAHRALERAREIAGMYPGSPQDQADMTELDRLHHEQEEGPTAEELDALRDEPEESPLTKEEEEEFARLDRRDQIKKMVEIGMIDPETAEEHFLAGSHL